MSPISPIDPVQNGVNSLSLGENSSSSSNMMPPPSLHDATSSTTGPTKRRRRSHESGQSNIDRAAARAAAVYYSECYMEGVNAAAADRAAREAHYGYKKWWLQENHADLVDLDDAYGDPRRSVLSSVGDAHVLPRFGPTTNTVLNQKSVDTYPKSNEVTNRENYVDFSNPEPTEVQSTSHFPECNNPTSYIRPTSTGNRIGGDDDDQQKNSTGPYFSVNDSEYNGDVKHPSDSYPPKHSNMATTSSQPIPIPVASNTVSSSLSDAANNYNTNPHSQDFNSTISGLRIPANELLDPNDNIFSTSKNLISFDDTCKVLEVERRHGACNPFLKNETGGSTQTQGLTPRHSKKENHQQSNSKPKKLNHSLFPLKPKATKPSTFSNIPLFFVDDTNASDQREFDSCYDDSSDSRNKKRFRGQESYDASVSSESNDDNYIRKEGIESSINNSDFAEIHRSQLNQHSISHIDNSSDTSPTSIQNNHLKTQSETLLQTNDYFPNPSTLLRSTPNNHNKSNDLVSIQTRLRDQQLVSNTHVTNPISHEINNENNLFSQPMNRINPNKTSTLSLQRRNVMGTNSANNKKPIYDSFEHERQRRMKLRQETTSDGNNHAVCESGPDSKHSNISSSYGSSSQLSASYYHEASRNRESSMERAASDISLSCQDFNSNTQCLREDKSKPQPNARWNDEYNAILTSIAPPQARTAKHVENAKTALIHALAVSGGDVTTKPFLFALERLRTLYNMTGWDARDPLGRNFRHCSKHVEGMWLTLSRPHFQESLGKNSNGEYMYTLGRMSFDMFCPTDLICSIQGVFNPVETVDMKDRDALTNVPKGLREELLKGNTILRHYNIVTAFTIEPNSPQFGHSSPNQAVFRPIKGIMTTFGYVLPDPNTPNRLSIWFSGGTIEVNEDKHDKNEWKRLFGGALPKRHLLEKARVLAAKLLLGAIVPDQMDEDGTMSYHLSRPVGGHGSAYVDILYLDDTLRIVQGHKGSLFVFARI